MLGVGRPFDFWGGEEGGGEGVYGWLQKKYIVQIDFKEKNLARKYMGRKFLQWKKSLIVYNAGEKNLTPLCARGKSSISRGLRKKF